MIDFAAILFGLIALFCYGFSDAIAKIPAGKIGSEKTVFYRGLFASILLIAVIPFFRINFSIPYILFTFALSVIGYFALVALFKALAVGKVGVVMPISGSAVVITVALSILFFNESLSAMQFFAIAIIFAGILMLSINFRSIKSSNLLHASSGIPYAFATCFLWGIMFFLMKIPVNIIGPVLTSFIIEFGAFLCSCIHLPVLKIKYSLSGKKILLPIFFVAFFASIGILSFNFGVEKYSVSIIAALTYASPLAAALYSAIAYRERLFFKQYIAIALIILGIFLVSYL